MTNALARRVFQNPRLLLVTVCILGIGWASSGITNEGLVSLDGDMPHYLMNGVFIRDLLHDAPLRAPLEYAQRYYARYPAITLGHHPFLPALAEAPFYLMFGVSVFSARLSIVAALGLALLFWFRLIRDIYDAPTAFFSSLLLISNPGVVPLFQVVLSEPYTLCLIILSVYFMHRYCIDGKRANAAAFFLSVVASAYAKHLAVFMFPVYAFQFLSTFGIRALFKRSTLFFVGGIALCLVPLVALTLKYSQFNVAIVTQFVKPGQRLSNSRLLRFINGLRGGQLRVSVPLLGLAGLSLIGAIIRRDRRIVLFVVWIASVYAGMVGVGFVNQRVFCYWLAAFCAIGAATFQIGSNPRWRVVWTVVLAATIGYQIWDVRRESAVQVIAGVRPAGAAGYEDAARYVADHRLGDTVLYSAAIDTGYFVFFVRKHDPSAKMVVLRADKVLTTSRMGNSNFRRQVNAREEILPILQRYGVGQVVVEDRPFADGPLLWLQQLVETDDFERVQRIPIESTDPRMRGATVSIYEYRGLTRADSDAALSISVPLMNDDVKVRLADLTGSTGRW